MLLRWSVSKCLLDESSSASYVNATGPSIRRMFSEMDSPDIFRKNDDWGPSYEIGCWALLIQ